MHRRRKNGTVSAANCARSFVYMSALIHDLAFGFAYNQVAETVPHFFGLVRHARKKSGTACGAIQD